MTPKQKADELIDKYMKECNIAIAGAYCIWQTLAKKQAMIVVDEIMELPVVWYDKSISEEDGDTIEYWEQVKQEIKP